MMRPAISGRTMTASSERRLPTVVIDWGSLTASGRMASTAMPAGAPPGAFCGVEGEAGAGAVRVPAR